jgi:hypothetical protein
MKNCILFLMLAIALATSCDDTETQPVCNVDNPVEDLDWLADRIGEMTGGELQAYFYVTRATYGLRPVFIFRNCCPFCSTIVPVYSCTGVLLGMVGDSGIDPRILEHDIIVWAPDNFACTRN